eukprot:208110-Rhodomonas_salina.1
MVARQAAVVFQSLHFGKGHAPSKSETWLQRDDDEGYLVRAPRKPIQETAISVQYVPGMRFLVFYFAL